MIKQNQAPEAPENQETTSCPVIPNTAVTFTVTIPKEGMRGVVMQVEGVEGTTPPVSAQPQAVAGEVPSIRDLGAGLSRLISQSGDAASFPALALALEALTIASVMELAEKMDCTNVTQDKLQETIGAARQVLLSLGVRLNTRTGLALSQSERAKLLLKRVEVQRTQLVAEGCLPLAVERLGRDLEAIFNRVPSEDHLFAALSSTGTEGLLCLAEELEISTDVKRLLSQIL